MKLLVSLNNIRTWTPDLPGDGKKEKRNHLQYFAQQALIYLSHHFAQLSIIPNYLQNLTLVLLLLNFKDGRYLVDILEDDP